jgi:hypothetical protein
LEMITDLFSINVSATNYYPNISYYCNNASFIIVNYFFVPFLPLLLAYY